MIDEKTLLASGALPISQAIATDICVITDPGPGRYKVWGTVRHTLADGVRLCVGPVAGPTILAVIPNQATNTQDFGPIVLDILNRTDDIILELALATGGADTASGILYAQKLIPT